MDRLVLIDGNAIIHRAYHAYPLSILTSQGELVNAVYGFTSILLTTLYQLKPKYAAVAFDKKGPTFRHKKYPGYKAHRPKMDQELINQFERVRQVVQTLNLPIFEISGFEADDTIASLAQQAKNQEVVIATGDQDILQLINPQIKVFLPARGKKSAILFNQEVFQQKYGFKPQYLVDFKSLAGDASDEIPGVKGIGPKTAQKLIQAWGTMEQIYQNLNQKKSLPFLKETIRQKLLAGFESAKLSKYLAKIVTDIPLKFNLKDCLLLDYNQKKALQLFEELEFKTLIKKLPLNWQEIRKEKTDNLSEAINQKNNDEQMELF